MSNQADKDKSKKVSLWKAFKVEAGDRWLSTKDRLIKVLGIIFIPFIYGFTCIAAFWNPLAKMGSVPMAIASLDQQQVLVQDYSTGDIIYDGKTECIGIPKRWAISSKIMNQPILSDFPLGNTFPDNMTLNDYLNFKSNGDSPTWILTEADSIVRYSHTLPNQVSPLGGAQSISFMDSIMTNWQDGNLGDNFTYDANKNTYRADISKEVDISNIKYHNVNDDTPTNRQYIHDANKLAELKDSEWNIKNTKDYGQISIPTDFTKTLINYVDASITMHTPADAYMKHLRDEKINFWLTYEKSFFAAKILDNETETFIGMVTQSLPTVLINLTGIQLNNIGKIIQNEPLVNGEAGYSWRYQGPDWNPSTSLTWSDHYVKYYDTAQTNSVFEPFNIPQGYASSTPDESQLITFKQGQLYTIPNEEYRAALIDKVKPTGDWQAIDPEASNAIYNAIAMNVGDQTGYPSGDPNQQYIVPSIEGITTSSDASDAAHTWNKYGAGATPNPNSNNALLTQITRATTILSEIPIISNGLASMVNFVVNDKISKLFNERLDGYIKMDMSSSGIETILSSDQFISSILMQDPRYMMIDDSVPIAAYVSFKSPLQSGGEFEFPFNFGGVMALMAYPIPAPVGNGKSAFQEVGVYSAYAAPNQAWTNNEYYYNSATLLNSLVSDLIYGENTGTIPPELLDFKDPNYANKDYSLPTTISSTQIPTYGESFIGNYMNNANSLGNLLHATFDTMNLDNYVDFDKVGSDWSYYGMGLGQYFICIGLFMGILSQIIIYDRKKRIRQISCRKWYLSKMMTVVCTSVLQACVLAASVAAIGWSVIGTAFVAQFFAMIFFSLIFVSIIGSIWFWFRDKSLGLIVVVVIMVLNLACGWGTFPAFTQFPIFHYISYVLPYTYMIHMQGAIVYGLGTGTHVAAAWGNIFTYAAILLIYPAIFIPLGLFMSKFRERDLLYGTWNRKKLGYVLKKAGLTQYLDRDEVIAKIDAKYQRAKQIHKGNPEQLIKDKTNRTIALHDLDNRPPMASWNRLPHEELPKIKAAVELIYPFKGKKSKFAVPAQDLIRDTVDFDEN